MLMGSEKYNEMKAGHMIQEMDEFTLNEQVKKLANRYFPRIAKIPTLKIQRSDDKEYQDSLAHLNALTGTIYIDWRVSDFQEKTTQILILHELIHWSLFLENSDPDEKEEDRFQAEIQRLWNSGAYRGLL